MILSQFWLDLSRVEANFRGKAISEGWVGLVEVSILPNFVWGKLPLEIGVFVLIVLCESCVRKVMS